MGTDKQYNQNTDGDNPVFSEGAIEEANRSLDSTIQVIREIEGEAFEALMGDIKEAKLKHIPPENFELSKQLLNNLDELDLLQWQRIEIARRKDLMLDANSYARSGHSIDESRKHFGMQLEKMIKEMEKERGELQKWWPAHVQNKYRRYAQLKIADKEITQGDSLPDYSDSSERTNH